MTRSGCAGPFGGIPIEVTKEKESLLVRLLGRKLRFYLREGAEKFYRNGTRSKASG